MMDGALKTPLKKVRGLGSAKSGTEHFWHQRLTGLANLVLLIGVAWFVIVHLGAPRGEVIASLKNPLVALLLVLAMFSVTWHMRLGLQVVIEDYVHSPARKFAALLFNTGFSIVMFAVAAYSILKMGFGA
jgi:succinate dehydrogenase / fumarate reductase, membrane anchor subunit